MEIYVKSEIFSDIESTYKNQIEFEANEFYKTNENKNWTRSKIRFMLIKNYISDIIQKMTVVRLRVQDTGKL